MAEFVLLEVTTALVVLVSDEVADMVSADVELAEPLVLRVDHAEKVSKDVVVNVADIVAVCVLGPVIVAVFDSLDIEEDEALTLGVDDDDIEGEWDDVVLADAVFDEPADFDTCALDVSVKTAE